MTKSSRPQSISDSVSVAGSQGTLDDLRARVASVPEAPTREPVDSRDEQAWSYCLRLLTSRARTRAELTERLARRGYPDDVSERIMDRLATAGLVNDADFATQWVQSRHTYSGKGKRALAAELRTKGVSAENAAAALAQIDGEAERSRAAELVTKKLRSENLDDGGIKAARRLVAMLARRGYGQSMAYDVVKNALASDKDRRDVG
ncbi:Probable regulatory protein RecX [Mycobacteroides abscessus subsp. massiliense]|uniref:recombination regulator RecX n=1 Tax=Mycobacteroides abscessus TaxID=36809 RepID=UPI0009A741C7|nr:recombination regulator RecX [Mycobacteroides abscessus]SKD61657.1 Probable regulatory protein RecX [Mycobacteroides abscessus subsp. massiliense]SKD82090.1 Probable regulatory protein RecX [Mycobacteroides abscessus subsp. massiliense]SKD87366.1 Probable regulatory protein RecX [Mycobacteroides abscessus subsp. massiliense]SKE10884.1 Probable regulatory protein RecX [Mycobacteroides abscessus subsp. massiliense]SKE33196.1 Probable regulatory protein RecX [Mycobacteroides abscessus subsp. m